MSRQFNSALVVYPRDLACTNAQSQVGLTSDIVPVWQYLKQLPLIIKEVKK
jgi:hypothetical protein